MAQPARATAKVLGVAGGSAARAARALGGLEVDPAAVPRARRAPAAGASPPRPLCCHPVQPLSRRPAPQGWGHPVTGHRTARRPPPAVPLQPVLSPREQRGKARGGGRRGRQRTDTLRQPPADPLRKRSNGNFATAPILKVPCPGTTGFISCHKAEKRSLFKACWPYS